MVILGFLVTSGAQALMLDHGSTEAELHRDRAAPGPLPELPSGSHFNS